MIEGLDEHIYALIVRLSGPTTLQRGLMQCASPNCPDKTRQRLVKSGIPVCAPCERSIWTGLTSTGRWEPPPKKRRRSLRRSNDTHVVLRGGPDNGVMFRRAMKMPKGSPEPLHRWKNGFIREGIWEELYVYHPADDAFWWWDRRAWEGR